MLLCTPIEGLVGQELEQARDCISMYKRVRSTIQNGLLYRLHSPRNAHVAASQYLAQDGSEVVVFVWGHSQLFGEKQVPLALCGLHRDTHYEDSESGVMYSGSYLMQHGLSVNLVGDFDSHMIHLVNISERKGLGV